MDFSYIIVIEMGQIYPFGINIYPWDHTYITSACFSLFGPTHPPTSAFIVLNVNKNLVFFSDPTHLFVDVIYGWFQSIYGTIHLRRRQIFTIFDPSPPTVGSFLLLSVGKFGQFLIPPP